MYFMQLLPVVVVLACCAHGQTDEQFLRLNARLEAIERRSQEQESLLATEKQRYDAELARYKTMLQKQQQTIERLQTQVLTDRRTYEQMMSALSEDIIHQSQVFGDLKQEVMRLEQQTGRGTNSSNNVGLRNTRGSPASPTAFLAYISKFGQNGPISLKERFVFDHVITNVGGAYDGTTGLFTAPEPGLYTFSVSVTSYRGALPLIEASLMKNGEALGFAYANGDSTSFDQGAVTATVSMDTGDLVWVENLYPDQGMYNGGPYTTFTGCLVV